jgi:hypothetical protein
MSGGLTLNTTYDFNVSVPHVNLRAWVSDTEWGELAGNDRLVGERFYLCCEITDLNTGKQLDSRVSGYSVTLTIYKPDGTVQHTITRDETSNLRTHDWISTVCKDAGKWQGKVTITGDFEVECEVSWIVNDPNAPEVTVTDDDVTLDFKWGTDNWSFSNTDDYFPNGYFVDDEMIDKLADEFKFTNIEREIMKIKGKSEFSTKWGGSCFGLSLSEILSKQGDIDLSKYGGNSTVNANTNSNEMLSLINFMQLLQNIPRYSQISRLNSMEKIPETVSQEKIIKTAVSSLQNDGKLLMLSYGIADKNASTGKTTFGYHAVIAYGVQGAKYHSNVTGKDYDRRLLIADPNRLGNNKLTDDTCLYYSSKDYSWIIPYQNYNYKDANSVAHTSICYWNAADKLNVNNGCVRNVIRFVSKKVIDDLTVDVPNTQYLPGVNVISDGTQEPEINKVKGTGNDNYDKIGGGKNVEPYSINSAGTDKTCDWLWRFTNPTAEHYIKYAAPYNYSFVMDYQHFAYIADIENGTYTQFYPEGRVDLQGKNMNYKVSIVSDDSVCVTDWYTVQVEGTGASNIVYSAADKNVYLLKADNMKNVKVTAYNDDARTEVTFSTDSDRVQIEEVDQKTIRIKIDTDGDDIFDKVIATSGKQTPVTTGTTTAVTTTTAKTTTPAVTTTTTKTTAPASTTSSTVTTAPPSSLTEAEKNMLGVWKMYKFSAGEKTYDKSTIEYSGAYEHLVLRSDGSATFEIETGGDTNTYQYKWKLSDGNVVLYSDESTDTAILTKDDSGLVYIKGEYTNYFEKDVNDLIGDLDKDGKPIATDAALLLKLYADLSSGERNATAEELYICDVNRNGKIEAGDASTILKYYAEASGGYDKTIDVYLKEVLNIAI